MHQQVFVFKNFCMETRFSNIFKTTNVANFTKVILKSSYRLLQVTPKWKTPKQFTYFLQVVEFRSTFDIRHVPGKVAKPYFCRSLSKYTNIHTNRATHYKIKILWKYEKPVFFGGSFFKTKIAETLDFCWIKYLSKGL